MKLHCGVPFSDEERASALSAIHTNINRTLHILLDAAQANSLTLLPDTLQHAEELRNFYDLFKSRVFNIPPNLEKSVLSIWNDPSIQQTFKFAAQYNIPDNIGYFMDEIPRILKDKYTPNDEDIIKCRSPTLIISETKLDIIKNGNLTRKVCIYDVGGQV